MRGIHTRTEQTWGSETSQYPQETKSTEIPSVAASERGIAQTASSDTRGVVGLSQGVARDATTYSQRYLERSAKEGDSPVGETRVPLVRHLSTAGLVESRWNLGGPSPKAKYYLPTDSEPVP